jgi:hypothetical protein
LFFFSSSLLLSLAASPGVFCFLWKRMHDKWWVVEIARRQGARARAQSLMRCVSRLGPFGALIDIDSSHGSKRYVYTARI